MERKSLGVIGAAVILVGTTVVFLVIGALGRPIHCIVTV